MTLVVALGFMLMTGTALAAEKPWSDWPDTDIAAGQWVKEKVFMVGFSDGNFYPHRAITPYQFSTVLDRVGIKSKWIDGAVTIGDAKKYLPYAKVSSSNSAILTRYRLAVILYRHFVTPLNPDQVVIKSLEKLIAEKKVTYRGVTRTRLVGHAATFVNDSRKYNIPIWFALGQCWAESQWFNTGLATKYNCGFGLKDTRHRWGQAGSPALVSGYANYSSIDEAIHAYFRLVSSPNMPYKSLIASGKTQAAINIYAPPYENNVNEYYSIMLTVKRWCDSRGVK